MYWELAQYVFINGILQILVALFVNFWLFFYQVKIKGYQHHYWLFNFFPTVFASVLPDVPKTIARILEFYTGSNFASQFWHDLFHTIFVSWIFIPFIVLFVWLLAKTEKFKMPKDWIWYVVTVSLVSMIIHLYIMDPLGF